MSGDLPEGITSMGDNSKTRRRVDWVKDKEGLEMEEGVRETLNSSQCRLRGRRSSEELTTRLVERVDLD